VSLFSAILITITFIILGAHNYQQSLELADLLERMAVQEQITQDVASLTVQSLKRLTAASDRQREVVRALEISDWEHRKALKALDLREQAHYRRAISGWSR
jgi:hypothetical protein